MADYQIWLTDPLGRRITSLDKYAYFSYTKTSRGLGTILIGFPFDYIVSKLGNDYFALDNRIDVWRRPLKGMELSRDTLFFLRKFRIYQRAEDNMLMIEYFGRSAIDLLRRGYTYTATPVTESADNFMVRVLTYSNTSWVVTPYGTLITPSGVISGNGPSLTIGASDYTNMNVLDALTDIKSITETEHNIDPAQKKCYFDLVPTDFPDGSTLFTFNTYAGIRGADRTSGTVFSIENGNLIKPSYEEDYLDEITMVHNVVSYFAPDANLSALNVVSKYSTAFLSDPADDAHKILAQNAAKRTFSGVFVDSPGGPSQPRSLYGLDWDLGDLLPVRFAGKTFSAEVVIIYVNIDDKGKEEVTGRTEVGE